MNHCDKVLLIKISLLIFVVIPLLESCHRGMPDPPLAKEIIHTDTLNGIAVTDPFHWMESAGDTALLSYIMAENSYTDEYMALLPGLMQSLCRELKERNGNSNVTDEKPANQNTCDSPDGKSRIYVNDAGQVRFHQTGSNGGNDPVIFSETRPGFKAGVAFSASKKFLFIRSFCHNRSETRFLPAGLQSLKPVLIQPGEPGLFYSAEHYGADYFWILTNHKAPHGKLVQAKIANPGLPFWIPAVIYPDSTILKAFTVINMKFLLLLEQKSFRASVRIVDLTAINDPSKGNKINFNDPEGELVFDGYEAESGKALIRYSSLLTPATLYTYDLEANKLGIRWQVNIHGYAKENYGARTLMIKSKDGFSIPVTIIFNKDFEMRDGSSPLLLVSGDLPEFTRHSQFNASWLSLLDRGFYIAVIHLPDDSETGDTLINNSGSAEKKNTNREFTDCINFLVSEKYTSLGKIAAIGIFSGGMALLDAVNNYPGLIKGVVLDQSLTTPLPASIAEKRAYPPLFLYAGKQDSGRYALAMIKMTALLRKNKTDKNILLFTAGNAVSNKGDYACGERELPEAEQAAFILSCLGIKK